MAPVGVHGPAPGGSPESATLGRGGVGIGASVGLVSISSAAAGSAAASSSASSAVLKGDTSVSGGQVRPRRRELLHPRACQGLGSAWPAPLAPRTAPARVVDERVRDLVGLADEQLAVGADRHRPQRVGDPVLGEGRAQQPQVREARSADRQLKSGPSPRVLDQAEDAPVEAARPAADVDWRLGLPRLVSSPGPVVSLNR